MPSKMIDQPSFSPSTYLTEEVHFPSERQIGFWNSETKIESYAVAARSGVSSPLDKPLPLEFQGMDCIKYPETYQVRESKASTTLGRLAVGAERNGSRSSQFPSYFSQDTKTNMMASQYENGLFSSSMSDLFSTKLRLTTNGIPYGHSVDTVDHHFEEEEAFESSKEIEAQTIGNLLPDDDDLLSGVTNDLDKEDLDLFSSVGGIELGDDGSSTGQENSKLFEEISNRLRGGFSELTIGEHPSRTLFVRNINNNIEDKELRALFELYGDIQTLYTAYKHRGFVIISYYDLRAACNAMRALQNKPLRHKILDIHFLIPKDNLTEKDINQGNLVVFNLDSSISNDELYKIFGIYGDIKEIRETSHRSNHKFIEFYDSRSAEAALRALNRTNVAGKRIEVETTHTGGAKKQCSTQQFLPELEQTELLQNSSLPNKSPGIFGSVPLGDFTSGITKDGNRPFMKSPFHHEISSSVPNGLSSMGRVESFCNQFGLATPGHSHSHGQLQFEYQGMPDFHPHSLPEYQDSFSINSSNTMPASTRQRSSGRIENAHFSGVNSIGNPLKLNETVFSSGNESCSVPLHHYMWANSHNPRPPSMMWSNSPSHIDRFPMAHHPSQLHGLPRPPSYICNPVIPLNNHHVGSAPTINSAAWDRQHSFVGEFPKSVGMHSPHQRGIMFAGRGQMLPMMSSFDNPNERTRSRRNENNQNNADNIIQYELDVERIMAGEDTRTTLMLKNIPNKYTSKMLLAALDERHRGTYDFIYLPIDFKNKCNVGYAFINMINPSVIVPFYEAFNGKKWEKFNSEKVASLAYARIQGKTALVAHFQNSSLMNEDKRCRPILFHTDGPNAGDQVPFPVGVNIRPRLSKTRTSTNVEINQGSPPNVPNKENSACGDSYSGSSRDSE